MKRKVILCIILELLFVPYGVRCHHSSPHTCLTAHRACYHHNIERFTLFTRRKHHCRVCGFLVCAECSPYQINLSNLPEEIKIGGSRICSTCFAFNERDPKYAYKLSRDGSDEASKCPATSLIATLNSSLMSNDMSFLLKDNPNLLDESTKSIERVFSADIQSLSDTDSDYSTPNSRSGSRTPNSINR